MAEKVRGTQFQAQVLTRQQPPKFRATMFAAMALLGQSGNLRVSQFSPQVAVRAVPNVEWQNVVMKIRFPRGVSEGSEAVGRYNTDAQSVDSGHRQSIKRWDEGLKRFDVAKGIDTMEQMVKLDAFHRAVQGAGTPFLFEDPTDNSTADWVGQDPGTIANDDVRIGIGNASTVKYQLIKAYGYDDGDHAAVSTTRTITQPIVSTVRVAINSTQVSNISVNASTGCLTFVAKASVKRTDIDFQLSAGRQLIFTVGGDFTVFSVGDDIQISGSTNNATVGQTVHSIASVTSTLIHVTNSASVNDISTEAAGGNVTINTHPAPRVGDTITAGFHFDIPVAFLTDELPLSLSQYNIGEAQVMVEEVRVETSC